MSAYELNQYHLHETKLILDLIDFLELNQNIAQIPHPVKAYHLTVLYLHLAPLEYSTPKALQIQSYQDTDQCMILLFYAEYIQAFYSLL